VGEAHIRHERPGDEAAITEITQLAFRGHPHSDNREHLIVLALRSAGALSISLVAEDEGEVVGHLAFSPVTISDGSTGWYGLGPVSVLPRQQGHGVGTALVRKSLDILRAMGAKGCVVLGEPAYYGRFGFEHRADCSLPGVPAGYFQSLSFKGPRAKGDVTYHVAFDEASATRP
jgi:putative acetyltransferase